MTIDMNDDHMVSVAQLKEFVKIHTKATFKSTSTKKETYEWINNALNKFKYRSVKKKEKSIVKKYVMNITGYSEGTIDKLIACKKKHGRIFVKKENSTFFPNIL
jgi:predicted DNA-binding transcriptional regulator AlpA